jgi:hypothetical protein
VRSPWKKSEPQRRIDWLLARRRAARAPIRKPGLLGALGRADQAVLRFLRTKAPHDPATESVVKGLGLIGEHAAVWALIGIGGAMSDPERRRRWLIAAATGPAAVVANYGVKLAFGRPRPILEEHPPLARAPSKLSFPSAHSTSSMAAATAFGRVEPRTRVPLYALATAICASRPYLGMHYPSDVIAGAAFGILIGGFVPGVGERTLEERMADFVATQPAAAAQGPEAPATEGSDPSPLPGQAESSGAEGSDPGLGSEGSDPA